MDIKHFKLILRANKLNLTQLSKKLDMTYSVFTWKIRNNRLLITEIFDILDILGLEFDDVFIKDVSDIDG